MAPRLNLRFDLPYPERPNYPVVTILVDGEHLFDGARRGDVIGFDPADILGADAPLLPTDPPRRVAVYRCNCGEPGCGVVAPLIGEEDGRITWFDFRDYTGVFIRRPTLDDPLESEGKALPISDLAFDSAQYRAEVARASADDSWETPARKAARLLEQYLEDDDAVFVRAGFTRGWVAPHRESGRFRVSFNDADGQTVVELTPAPGTPENQANEMAETLVRTPPQAWNITSRNLWPHVRAGMTVEEFGRKRRD